MAFTIIRTDTFVGGKASKLAFTRNPAEAPHLLSVVWTGSQLKHSFWDLLPNGGISEVPVDTKSGGPQVAVAAFSDKRAVSIHRSGPSEALKFEAWITGNVFGTNGGLVWQNDRDPQIVCFGNEPPVMAAAGVAAPKAAVAMKLRQKKGPGGSGQGASQPGTLGQGPHTRKPYQPVGGISASIGPKVARALVVSRTSANKLRLSLWMFDNGGQISTPVTKHAQRVSDTATAVSVAKLREFWSADGKHVTGLEVVTAVRGAGHALRLQRWLITLGGQGVPTTFQMLSDVTAPETVKLVSIVPVPSLGGVQVATAVALNDGTLKVIAWKMETDGSMARLADTTAGGITSLRAAYVRGRCFVTATREADERFKANYWVFPNNPAASIQHKGNAVEGKIGAELSCVHLPGFAAHLGDTIFATQTEGGDLQLWCYEISE